MFFGKGGWPYSKASGFNKAFPAGGFGISPWGFGI
jgi:hypothetical protein